MKSCCSFSDSLRVELLGQTVQDFSVDGSARHERKSFTGFEVFENDMRLVEHELAKNAAAGLHVDLVRLRLFKGTLVSTETLEDFQKFFSRVPHLDKRALILRIFLVNLFLGILGGRLAGRIESLEFKLGAVLLDVLFNRDFLRHVQIGAVAAVENVRVTNARSSIWPGKLFVLNIGSCGGGITVLSEDELVVILVHLSNVVL